MAPGGWDFCGSGACIIQSHYLKTKIKGKTNLQTRKRSHQLLAAVVIASLWSPTKGHADDTRFVFPEATTSGFEMGRKNVGQDLLKLQRAEVIEAENKVSKDLTPAEQNKHISARLQAANRDLLKMLDGPSNTDDRTESFDTDKATSVTEEQARQIFNLIKEHPVVGDKATLAYDTPSRQIGYCFGRAAFVHAELLRRGVRPSSIGKVFAVGGLLYQRSGWNFHVATIVRRRTGGWIVIDPLINDVSQIENWARMVLSWSEDPQNSRLRFYFSDPVKFQPVPGNYSEKSLMAPYYHGYFKDMIKWFDSHPIGKLDKFDEPNLKPPAGTKFPPSSRK